MGRGNVLNDNLIKEIADKHTVSPAQLCIRYCLQKDILPLPISSNANHIKTTVALDFDISQTDMKRLGTLDIETIEFGNPA